MFGSIIQDELKKLADQMAALTGLKHELYQRADLLLVEGQGVSKEKLDEWFMAKRVDLAEWANEAPPVPVNPTQAPGQ